MNREARGDEMVQEWSYSGVRLVGGMIPKPPSLAGSEKIERNGSLGGSWPVRAGMNFVLKMSGSEVRANIGSCSA